MRRVHILVEGQTELQFVKRVLWTYFSHYDLDLDARAVETSRTRYKIHRGGITSYLKAKNDLLRWIKENPKDYFSTMFDFYALPNDFPGMSSVATNACRKVKLIEEAIKVDIPHHRFIPYIQLHEFEALLFTDIRLLKAEFEGKDREIEMLYKSTRAIAPEDINNSPETAPSKRILSFLPIFDKVSNGVSIAEAISVDEMCKVCPHFNEWITKLKKIAILP